MTMENLMQVLMQSAAQSQQSGADPLAGVLGSLLGGGQQGAPQGGVQQSAGGDALGQVLGGLLGGQQQQGGMPQQAAGGDMFGSLLGGMLGGQQQAPMQQQSAGGGMLGQLVGGLLGGGMQTGGYQQNYQPTSNSGDMLLGALESIIGGQPGSGQALPLNQGNFNLGATSPVMGLLQPVVNQVAGKLNISPQIATVVASIALHYLLSSHSSTSPNAPLKLDSVMQQMSRGSISQGTLRNSGMVNDVMSATGLNKQQAIQSLETTLGAMGAGVQGQANFKRG